MSYYGRATPKDIPRWRRVRILNRIFSEKFGQLASPLNTLNIGDVFLDFEFDYDKRNIRPTILFLVFDIEGSRMRFINLSNGRISSLSLLPKNEKEILILNGK